MFIESAHGGHWNLLLCVNYRRDKKGVLHLVFPQSMGGNFKVTPAHPQYRQIERHLLAATLPHDS
ncbi:hypothetical protein [Microbacterium oleivorans]|mgnify:CR=1 FL=1|uniref:hypothetical protein n=1 Tax=Microbacterium oleivorans TaxID=273677 RepID=UPI00080E8FC2|nr:hypothetical protein [Microbacterium oleivorans]